VKIPPKGVIDMDDEVRQFVIDALGAMNYDVSDVTGDTDLGPAGLDLESLAVAELAVQVEDKFGVKFTDEDTENLALMTLDEFAAEVASRIGVTAGGKAE
jgi:acyl carrier protein